jgi:hypothetical protein
LAVPLSSLLWVAAGRAESRGMPSSVVVMGGLSGRIEDFSVCENWRVDKDHMRSGGESVMVTNK